MAIKINKMLRKDLTLINSKKTGSTNMIEPIHITASIL
ncbi:hypothetical protein K151_1610 [Proteus hauseri ZMd44]|nr:hypothetical protein K151_1610 [Proteus hauseri ZMd44]